MIPKHNPTGYTNISIVCFGGNLTVYIFPRPSLICHWVVHIIFGIPVCNRNSCQSLILGLFTVQEFYDSPVISLEYPVKIEHTDSKCDFLKKSKIYGMILCNVFFKMTHVLPLISAQTCGKKSLQNRRGRPVLNKIGSLTIVFSVFSFAKICQCTQFLPHHIYKSIKDITMNFGSLIENSLIYCTKLF